MLIGCGTIQDPGNIDSVAFLFRSGARVTTQRTITNNVNTIPYFQAASTAIKAAVDVGKIKPEEVKQQIANVLGDKINDELYPFFEVGIELIIDTYKRFYEVNNIGDKIDDRVVVILTAISDGMDEAIKAALVRGFSIQDALEPNPFKRATDEDLKL
jgi:hypothetical protein